MSTDNPQPLHQIKALFIPDIWAYYFPITRVVMDTNQREMTQKERLRAKHQRYYAKHKEEIRLKAHEKYFKTVHNISDPPPIRRNLKRL